MILRVTFKLLLNAPLVGDKWLIRELLAKILLAHVEVGRSERGRWANGSKTSKTKNELPDTLRSRRVVTRSKGKGFVPKQLVSDTSDNIRVKWSIIRLQILDAGYTVRGVKCRCLKLILRYFQFQFQFMEMYVWINWASSALWFKSCPTAGCAFWDQLDDLNVCTVLRTQDILRQ